MDFCLNAFVIRNNHYDLVKDKDFSMDQIEFKPIYIIENIPISENRIKYFTAYNTKLWRLLDFLVILDKAMSLSSDKSEQFKKVYKNIF